MYKVFDTIHGEVKVKNVMVDHGTDLDDGIEIISLEDDFETITISEYYDIEELEVEELEELIEDNKEY